MRWPWAREWRRRTGNVGTQYVFPGSSAPTVSDRIPDPPPKSTKSNPEDLRTKIEVKLENAGSIWADMPGELEVDEVQEFVDYALAKLHEGRLVGENRPIGIVMTTGGQVERSEGWYRVAGGSHGEELRDHPPG